MHTSSLQIKFAKKLFPLGIAGGLLLIFFLCGILLQKATSAATLSDWDPGLIIDDQVMTNKNAMTVSQIQSFLNAKVTSCDTNGQQLSEYGGPDLNKDGKVQRWEWGKAKYNQTTFPCLKDYKQNNLSSAQIIYNASQKYSINPQVLIVLLQKEQGLVTDTWPLNIQYRSATGYGCPDTAPCDAEYYGLTNQLDWSATMFRSIIDNNPNWSTPYVLGKNFIQYNPNSSCGGTTVNIKNRSTQALYNYTPYQPNKAALSAGYGDGDSCSAHGNRNFYLYFTDWFGSTQGTPFFKIKNSDKIYTLGSNNNYYHVPSWEIMEAYGWGKSVSKIATYDSSYITNKSYSGHLSRTVRFENNDIYLADRGQLHLFGPSVLKQYGYVVGDEATLPATNMASYLTVSRSVMRTIAVDETGKIYLVANSKKCHFSGPSAYRSGNPPYSSLPGTGLSNEFLASMPNAAPIYAPGTPVRQGSSDAVYIITSLNTRSAVPSRDYMSAYGYSFESVRSISESDMNTHTLSSPPLDFVVKSNTDKIYVVGPNGIYREISADLLNTSYTFINPANLQITQDAILQTLRAEAPLTKVVRKSGENTVYYVQGGKRKAIKNREELSRLGFTMDQVRDLPIKFIDRIPQIL